MGKVSLYNKRKLIVIRFNSKKEKTPCLFSKLIIESNLIYRKEVIEEEKDDNELVFDAKDLE